MNHNIHRSNKSLYLEMWNHINKRRRKQLIFLLILIVATSFAEIFSIGAVFPFLAVLTNPEKVFKIGELQFLWDILEIQHSSEVLVYVTASFVIAALVSGAMRLLLIYATTRLSFGMGADISYEIYRRTLHQPYIVHIGRNSAEIITGITSKASSVVTQVFTPVLTLISSSVILITILISLLLIDPEITLISFAFFFLLYIIIAYFTKSSLSKNGKLLAENLTIVQKSLYEGLGGIRDILIDRSQYYFLKNYQISDLLYRKASANSYYLGASPRYIMESLGMVLLGIFAYYLGRSEDTLMSAIPVLGSLAVAAQRVLPILQQSYFSWSNLRAGNENLSNVVELLNQSMDHLHEENKSREITFKKEIELKDISFQYNRDQDSVLKNINLTIRKGSRIGIIGKTGSGKSTLLDILMGLLIPSNGELLIDGNKLDYSNLNQWYKMIAHVPQNIYLSDSSIAENIAFGIKKEEIDHERLKSAARKANISDHIESLPEGYQTFVGERGVKLSGGQRQRIGIARALYKNASIIFLDEATSALDNATEKEVIQAIESLDDSITIFIIAHRLSTIEGCNQIIELNEGLLREKKLVTI